MKSASALEPSIAPSKQTLPLYRRSTTQHVPHSFMHDCAMHVCRSQASNAWPTGGAPRNGRGCGSKTGRSTRCTHLQRAPLPNT
eukprot:1011112-Prymnesium_polylepis.1